MWEGCEVHNLQEPQDLDKFAVHSKVIRKQMDIHIPSIIHLFRNQIGHELFAASSLVKEVLQPARISMKYTHVLSS